MYEYGDPSGANFADNAFVRDLYRSVLHTLCLGGARKTDAAFAMLDGFDTAAADLVRRAVVDWRAYPITAADSDEVIDAARFRLQDEYVEWAIDKSDDGLAIAFTTEFSEYFEAFAASGYEAILAQIRRVYPDAAPTPIELYGMATPESLTPAERARRFRDARRFNPWNNGAKGILFLDHPNNTLGALINLMTHCSVARRDIDITQVCAAVGQYCSPDRSSDPGVSALAQRLARQGQAIGLADPIGVAIVRLDGTWTLDGAPIDITTHAHGGPLWTVSRNRRRAVLHVPADADLRLDGAPVVSGAQVARVLSVGAEVIAAPAEAVAVPAETPDACADAHP